VLLEHIGLLADLLPACVTIAALLCLVPKAACFPSLGPQAKQREIELQKLAEEKEMERRARVMAEERYKCVERYKCRGEIQVRDTRWQRRDTSAWALCGLCKGGEPLSLHSLLWWGLQPRRCRLDLLAQCIDAGVLSVHVGLAPAFMQEAQMKGSWWAAGRVAAGCMACCSPSNLLPSSLVLSFFFLFSFLSLRA